MTHGGNVWQGDRPGDWLDLSASVRPGGAPQWVRQGGVVCSAWAFSFSWMRNFFDTM